ncbi:unnamed protein product [Clonostachys chloroleuca]|uniref:Uncharacterized protein n=1 Tax=Clonostachys chloroleuca TaxID=1926264 RepID=A0AA35QF02_9HYPO|nr:unnamed protein product [Clonostachys chloroleuca]
MDEDHVTAPDGVFGMSDETTQILLRSRFSGVPNSPTLSQQEISSLGNTERASVDQGQPVGKPATGVGVHPELPEGLLIREMANSSDMNHHDPQSQQNVIIIWILEILTLVFAAGLLIAICVLFRTYNGQTQPDWGNSGITLNALIATLSMIFRASLAFVSFEVVSQIKWDWIASEFRPLRDLEQFDAASRGIYASLRLLPLAILHQPRAVLAILVTVSSLGIGPFMQQTIQTYQCLRKTGPDVHVQPPKITIANAISFSELGTVVRSARRVLSTEIRTAMQDAIVNPNLDSNIGALFTCQSGNCTFPPLSNAEKDLEQAITHSSIGMCNRCVDVYDFVQEPLPLNISEGKNFPVFNLPVYQSVYNGNGYELNLEEGPMRIVLGRSSMSAFTYMQIRGVRNLTWTREVATPDFIYRARWAVYNFTVLAASRNHCNVLPDGNVTCPQPCLIDDLSCPFAFYEPSDYVAAACTVYPCLKHYSASVDAGKLEERIVHDIPLRLQSPEPLWSADLTNHSSSDFKAVQQPCWVNGTLYTTSNMSSSESLGRNVTEIVQSHIDDWMNESIEDPAHYTNITAPRECVGTMNGHAMMLFHDNPFDNVSCSYDTRMESLQCRGNLDENIDQSSLVALMRGPNTSMETLQENIDSLTTRLTTEIRKRGTGAYNLQKVFVTGDEWEARVCVRILWQWITLPTTTFALCTLLLLWTIIKDAVSRNGTIWKSSPIPLILKDYPGLERMGLDRMGQIVKGLEIKLEKQKKI